MARDGIPIPRAGELTGRTFATLLKLLDGNSADVGSAMEGMCNQLAAFFDVACSCEARDGEEFSSAKRRRDR